MPVSSRMSGTLLCVLLLLGPLGCARADLSTCTCSLKDVEKQTDLPLRCGAMPVLVRMVNTDVQRMPLMSEIAILRAASTLKYVNTYFKALQNSVAYADRYGYDNYVYMDAKGKLGKAIGILALFQKVPVSCVLIIIGVAPAGSRDGYDQYAFINLVGVGVGLGLWRDRIDDLRFTKWAVSHYE